MDYYMIAEYDTFPARSGPGIYFAKRDIFAFVTVGYGSSVYKVTVPDGVPITIAKRSGPLERSGRETFTADQVNLTYVGPWTDINVMKKLIGEGADIHVDNENAFRQAAGIGDVRLLTFLLDHKVDIHALDDDALMWAAEEGNMEAAHFLLDIGLDVHASKDEARHLAIENGHDAMVRYFEDYAVMKAEEACS